MAEILRAWLRTRLGVIIDLSPKIFGRYCRDGTFLAKLLHSYDIINDSQLQTITQTSDPALARVNLRHLRCWLRFIGVDCDDECIKDISNGKGTASLRLFYKVFLCLENKDRLHFITLQKEREKYIPNSTKFDVKVVTEEIPIGDLPKHPLLSTLAEESASLTDWHRKKFQKIIDKCKVERENFRASQASNESLKKLTFNKFSVLQAKKSLKKNKMAELDEFTEKHRVESSIDSQLSLNERLKIFPKHTSASGDPEAVKKFMISLKNRKSLINTTQNYKVQMQKTLLSDVWNKMAYDQEREFDRIIAKKIIDQSQYEKQMVKKLCDIRNQKNRIAANRQLVDELMINTRENELRMMQETERENIVRENEEVDDEYKRMNELYQRIELEKKNQINQKLYRLTMKILYDIIDISVKAAEFKRANDNYIPVRIWNEWKALFHKNLPIYELPNDFYHQEEDIDKNEDENINDFFEVELTKKKILNERDFDDYLNIKSPWYEFMPVFSDEMKEYLYLGAIVLGYIINKLLQFVYPPPPEVLKPPLPNVKVRAVVIGIPDPSFYFSLQELLKHKKIQVFTVEDAINYCLYHYKEEMKNFKHININIVGESSEKSSQLSLKNEKRQLKKNNKKEQRKLSKISDENVVSFSNMEDINIDKETQTPKVIPYDDTHPQLSDTAYIGKCTYEILTHGEILSDELTAKIIVEYLKNLVNIHGWVLLNYPKTYQQMSQLEFFFTGCKIPDQPDKLNQLNPVDIIIDETDPRPSRFSFKFGNNDTHIVCRESRLLPNPLNHNKISIVSTYLTSYIRMLQKSETPINSNEEEIIELCPEDTTGVDYFYINEGIASAVYYTTYNLSILERVGKIITGETSLPRMSLTQVSRNLPIDMKENQSKTNINDGKKFISTQNLEVKTEQIVSESNLVKPGESTWIWADFNLSSGIIKNLAILWENFENVYIVGLKEILELKRAKFTAVVPYKDFITQHMAEFLARSDIKQELVHQFQITFNNIPADIRDDNEVKCGLYCSVDNFQTELWDICHTRKCEADEECKRIKNDYWVVMEMMILTNIYIGIIQLEMDRFIDTVQLIQNYYLSMLKRSIDEMKFPKFVLHKLTMNTDNPNARGDGGNQSLEDNNKYPIKKPPLPGINESDLKSEVDVILMRTDKIIKIDVSQISCSKIIEANINYTRSLVDDIFNSATETLQRENNVLLPRRTSDQKGKKRLSKKRLSGKSSRSEDKILNYQKVKNLLEEWKYALMYEVNRIHMRLLILQEAKNSDIEFLLTTIQRGFFSIHQMLNDKYESEMKSVNDIIQIFCLAIEREIPIQEEIILDGNKISILSHSLMYPDTIEYPSDSIQEKLEDLHFTISQLGRLKDIFQRVAPSGFMSERSFVYILQDLVMCPDEFVDISPLPTSWYKLQHHDIVELVYELFGDTSYIDWREFLIYAMEVHIPNQDELLDVKEAFALNDRNSSGIIYRDQFILQPLWFITSSQSSSLSSLRSLLHDNFEKDEYEMFEEEFDIKNWPASFNSIRKFRKPKKNISFRINTSETFDSQCDINEQQDELTRMTLIKELLCEMYLNSYYTVNYIALLLAFCKDVNPAIGFGKALSLAMGKRVCLEFDEGEKYLNMLLEEKRLSADDKIQRIQQRQEAIKFNEELLIELIDKTIDTCYRSLMQCNSSSTTKIVDTFRQSGPILIEKLDQPGEIIDPATLFIEETTPAITSYRDDEDIYVSIEECDKQSVSLQYDEFNIKPTERETIYWLPISVCESVLSVLVPIKVIQYNISRTGVSLLENLKQIYRDVECKELNNVMDNTALAYRIVNHPFMVQLLRSTSKFTCKNLSEIMKKFTSNRRSSP